MIYLAEKGDESHRLAHIVQYGELTRQFAEPRDSLLKDGLKYCRADRKAGHAAKHAERDHDADGEAGVVDPLGCVHGERGDGEDDAEANARERLRAVLEAVRGPGLPEREEADTDGQARPRGHEGQAVFAQDLDAEGSEDAEDDYEDADGQDLDGGPEGRVEKGGLEGEEQVEG